METKGFIVRSKRGWYLGEYSEWWQHEKPEDAWVHSKEVLELSLQEAHKLKSKPHEIIPAVHDLETRKTTCGEPINIAGMSVQEVLERVKKK